MKVYRFKARRNRAIIRHAFLGSINVVLLVSCLAAPVAMIVMPAASIGATAPFPASWLIQLGNNLKLYGRLSQADIAQLQKLAGLDSGNLGPQQPGSAKKVEAARQRIYQYLRSQGNYDYEVWFLPPPFLAKGAMFKMQLLVFNCETAEVDQTVTLGPGINDLK